MVSILFTLVTSASDVGVLVVDPNAVFSNESTRREVTATLSSIAPDATVLARTTKLDAACVQTKSIQHCRGDLPSSVTKLYIIDFSKGSRLADTQTLVIAGRRYALR